MKNFIRNFFVNLNSYTHQFLKKKLQHANTRQRMLTNRGKLKTMNPKTFAFSNLRKKFSWASIIFKLKYILRGFHFEANNKGIKGTRINTEVKTLLIVGFLICIDDCCRVGLPCIDVAKRYTKRNPTAYQW